MCWRRTIPIDYARVKREAPGLKAALTRAEKIIDPAKRREAVVTACSKAVNAWIEWGAWPDNWSHWQRALSDAQYAALRAGVTMLNMECRLEDLV